MKIRKEELSQVEPFQKEKEKFYLLSVIATGEDPLLYSDNENYIVGRSEVGYPTWIWTIDNLKPEKVEEIKEVLENYLVEGENKFTCKKELYDLLSKEYDTKDYFEMGFLSCKEQIEPPKVEGKFTKPSYGDKVTLAEYWRDNNKELYKKYISQMEALEEVERWLDSEKFYVWKDTTGEAVCMAGYSTIDDLAKITHVFTPKEERGKGYCKNLIYSLSKQLMEEGKKPLLYTDYQYQASNKAYQAVGYEEGGILINFSIHKEKEDLCE